VGIFIMPPLKPPSQLVRGKVDLPRPQVMHAHENPFGGIAFYHLSFYNFAGRLWSGVHFWDDGRGEEGWESLDFERKMDWESRGCESWGIAMERRRIFSSSWHAPL